MPFQYSVADARNSDELRQVAAVCTSSPAFLSLLNQIQRRLLKRGDWEDTDWLARLCIHDGCITWPRWVAGLRAISFSGGWQTEIRNKWYSVEGPYSYTTGPNTFTDTGLGGSGLGVGWYPFFPSFDQQNSAPTYRDITAPEGRLIRYYVAKRNDVGKTLRIYGKAFGGEPLQEKDANGNWVEGITLTATAPFVSTSIMVTQITAITREATEGIGRLYAYDPVADVLVDLAMYEPSETNPRYRRTRVTGAGCMPGCRDANNVKTTSLQVLAKIAHQNLVSENDLLLIDDFDALKIGFQAIRLEESNDDTLSEVKLTKAIRELNFGIRNASPAQQTTVTVRSMLGGIVQNPI